MCIFKKIISATFSPNVIYMYLHVVCSKVFDPLHTLCQLNPLSVAPTIQALNLENAHICNQTL